MIVNDAISEPTAIRPIGTRRPGDGESAGMMFSQRVSGRRRIVGRRWAKSTGIS
jgi:hypothetical protein